MASIQNMDLRRSEMASGGRISWAENQAIGQVIAIAKRAIQPVEKWPKYYRGDNWCSMDAYVRFDDEYHEAIWVAADGTERVFHGERFHTIPERIEENSWREVTEAEALARVKPSEPLEIITADTDLEMSVMEMAKAFDKIATLVTPAAPAVKRVPVRLFMDDRNNMFAVCGEWPIVVGTQIKHDANGFYVEGEP